MENNEFQLDLHDNEWPFSYIDHDRPAARGIVYDDEGWFYFAKSIRKDVFGEVTNIETSGGGIDEGETPEEAIVRELKEELGAEVDVIRKLGVASDYVNVIHRHNINHYFLCKIKSFGDRDLTESEIKSYHLSTKKYRYEEALAAYGKCSNCKIGRLIAARDVPALVYAREFLEL